MELEETINSASKQLDTAKYTPQSIELLTVTLQKAKEVFNDDNATKHEVDEAINKLNEVAAALVEKADKNNLISIFNTALKLDKEKYTSESLTKVEALLEKVESIIDDENAAQAEVDEMYDQLHQALDQLVIKEDVNTNDKVEGDVTVIPTPEKEIPKDDSTSAAKTGDSVSIQILAGTLLISILGIGILRKRTIIKGDLELIPSSFYYINSDISDSSPLANIVATPDNVTPSINSSCLMPITSILIEQAISSTPLS